MYSHPQHRSSADVKRLRQAAGEWLRSLREKRSLSQRELALRVGLEYYTFVSQLETGRGRIPPDRYRRWAEVLGVDTRSFVRELMKYYDPVTHELLYPDAERGRFVSSIYESSTLEGEEDAGTHV